MGTIVRLAATEQLTCTNIQTKKRLIRNSIHWNNAPFRSAKGKQKISQGEIRTSSQRGKRRGWLNVLKCGIVKMTRPSVWADYFVFWFWLLSPWTTQNDYFYRFCFNFWTLVEERKMYCKFKNFWTCSACYTCFLKSE